MSDGSSRDKNGLWRLFDVLKDNGFIPPEVVQAYDVFCQKHPAPGNVTKERLSVSKDHDNETPGANNGDQRDTTAKITTRTTNNEKSGDSTSSASASSASDTQPASQSDNTIPADKSSAETTDSPSCNDSLKTRGPEDGADNSTANMIDNESNDGKSKPTDVNNSDDVNTQRSNSATSSISISNVHSTAATSLAVDSNLRSSATALSSASSSTPTSTPLISPLPPSRHDLSLPLQQQASHHHPFAHQQQQQQNPHLQQHHHQQNLYPLGPQQMFSCLVPDCVFSTPSIDDYRCHVHAFHPHLQLELLKNTLPSPPPYHSSSSANTGGLKHRFDSPFAAPLHPHPPSANHQTPTSMHRHPTGLGHPGNGAGSSGVISSPFDPAFGVSSTAMGGDAAAVAAVAAAMMMRMPGSQRKDASVDRFIEMRKCLAPDCDYHRWVL